MQKSVIMQPFHTVQDGKIIKTQCLEFSGQRFFNADMPDDNQMDLTENKPTMRYLRNEGWGILKGLIDIILYFRPFPVVEIGCGNSTLVLAEATEKANVKFYSCDKNPSKAISYHKNHNHLCGTSVEFMKRFDDIPAVVLIDGNHEYETAKSEFDFFFDKLVIGGVIFIHDTCSPHEVMLSDISCGDVYRLRQELEQRTDEMDCFTWPYTAKWCGLTQIIKKDPDRPYWEK